MILSHKPQAKRFEVTVKLMSSIAGTGARQLNEIEQVLNSQM